MYGSFGADDCRTECIARRYRLIKNTFSPPPSDEATSALDAKTESLILEKVFAICKEARMTLLVIAHKLSTVANADCITVMHKGVAVENGTHEELLRMRGFYHAMFKVQIPHNRDHKPNGRNGEKEHG